jgi:aryl sulfotransferase
VTGRIVWLASYPKSGNTWLRAVYTALRVGQRLDINNLDGGNIASSRELFDGLLGMRSSDLTPDEAEALRPRVDELAAASSADDFWRKVHDGLYPGPAGELIVSVEVTRIALYLIRDPRDVALSLAHHFGLPAPAAVEMMGCAQMAINESSRSLLTHLRQRLGSWSQHVRSWTDQCAFPVHVVRYEDCASDPIPTFREAFRQAGLDVAARVLEDAVAASAIARLRGQEQREGFKEYTVPGRAFFGRGAPGSWKKELPTALARRIEHDHGEVMARYGYL